MQAVYGMAFLCWVALLAVTRGKEGWHSNPLLRPILVLVAVNLLAAAFSVDSVESLRGIRQLTLVSMILVVGNVVARKEETQLLVVAWLASGVVASFYALGQYLDGMSRVSGPFGGAATLSRILVFTCTIALAISVLKGERRLRLFATLCLPAILSAVFLTFMRGGWLALFVAVSVLGILLKNRVILSALAVVFLLAVGLVFFTPQSNTSRLLSSIVHPMDPNSERFPSSNLQRYWMYKAAWGIFCDHPLVGVGQRNFDKVYPTYIPENLRSPDRSARDGTIYTGFTDAHNLYLNLLATQGILGLGGFLYVVGTAGWLAWQNYRRHEDAFLRQLSAGILAAIAGFLVFGLTLENSRDSESIIQLWFLIGIIVAVDRMTTMGSAVISSHARESHAVAS